LDKPGKNSPPGENQGDYFYAVPGFQDLIYPGTRFAREKLPGGGGVADK